MCIHCIFCKYFFSSNTFVRDNHENDSDEGPPFKSRPKPSNRGCNELEKMMIAERRKNRNNPRLKCDPRMRRVAVAHAKNQIRHRFDPMPDRVRPPNLKKIRYILTLFQSYTLLIWHSSIHTHFQCSNLTHFQSLNLTLLSSFHCSLIYTLTHYSFITDTRDPIGSKNIINMYSNTG